jgi:hypothetical protein
MTAETLHVAEALIFRLGRLDRCQLTDCLIVCGITTRPSEGS